MTGKVYFVECAGQIKIGFSKNVPARLRNLSKGNVMPLAPIGTIDGSQKLERAIHRRLAGHRNNGEWFTDCDEVRTIIAELMNSGPDAIGFIEPQVDSEVFAEPVVFPLPETYRFKNLRICLAKICIRLGHICGDLVELLAPWTYGTTQR